MPKLKLLRSLARYNVLTPVAVLAAAAMAQPVAAATITVNAPDTDGVVIPDGDSLVNNSDISTPTGNAVQAAGSVGSVTNAAGASITSTSSEGVVLYGPVHTFSNAGMITGILGVGFHDTVDTFRNEAGGVIEGTDEYAARFWGPVADFYNAGTISGGFESAAQFGLVVDRFVNAGTISSVRGITFEDDVGTFRNEAGAVIEGTDDEAINFNTSVDDFYNAGTIRGGSTGIFLSAAMSKGVNAAGGVITGQTGSAIMSDGYGEFLFDNAGTISGEIGIEIIGWGPQGSRITNSGIIEGTMGTAIHFGSGVGAEPRDDQLTLLTGSRIFGAVDFGLGDDTLDFSGFVGNTLLDVPGLESVESGTRNYVWDQSSEQIAIFDLTGASNIGNALTDVTGTINGVIGGQFGAGQGGSGGPLAYAPAGPQTSAEAAAESAVLSELDVGATDAKAWASAFGGRSSDTTPVALNNAFGGLVAGTHARLLEDTELGLLGGYARSQSDVQSGEQVVTSQTGILGLYGRTELGTVDVSFSLLGGYSGHEGSREVIALGVTETAQATYNSWFVAPSLGLDMPVLSGENGELKIVASAAYVGGAVAGYTETGSSMNLAVGSQAIGNFDGRLGLAGRLVMASTETGDISLQAKAGVFAQANFGGSTVPVTVLGQTITASAAGGSGFGVYAGAALAADLTQNVGLNAGLDASLRSDGHISAAAKAGIESTF